MKYTPLGFSNNLTSTVVCLLNSPYALVRQTSTFHHHASSLNSILCIITLRA